MEADLRQTKVASILALLAGIWILISPIWFVMTRGQSANAIIIGVIVAIMALVQLGVKNTVPSWINGLAAVWLFVTAFIFNASTASRWELAISAVVVFALSIWDGEEMAHFERRHGHGAMTT
jgi:hypothetical protein